MMNVALGAKDEKILTSLANRVIRLNSQMTPAERKQFEEKSGYSAGNCRGKTLNAFDEDVIEKGHSSKPVLKSLTKRREKKPKRN